MLSFFKLLYKQYLIPRRYLMHFYGQEYTKHRNIVLHDKKLIYFYIPKNASSSLKRLCVSQLYTAETMPEEVRSVLDLHNAPHKIPYPYIPRDLLHRFDDYFRFAFVRNPWDRIASFYAQKINRDDVASFLLPFGFYPYMPFEECVALIETIDDSRANEHFLSQHVFITNKKGEIAVDFIGRFERFDEDLRQLSEQSGLSITGLRHMNKTRRPNYQEMYNANTRDIIARRYEKDISIFNYSF